MENKTIINETNKEGYQELYDSIMNQAFKQQSSWGLLYTSVIIIALIIFLTSQVAITLLLSMDFALLLGGTGYLIKDHVTFKKKLSKKLKEKYNDIDMNISFKQLEEELTNIGSLQNTMYGVVKSDTEELEACPVKAMTSCSNILTNDSEPKKLYKNKKLGV